MIYVLACWPAVFAVAFGVWCWLHNRKKALRYAVTLTNNEGAFVALCIQKRWGYWTFVDVRVTPTNPGGAVLMAAPGQLYVPCRNILYYQEMANAAE